MWGIEEGEKAQARKEVAIKIGRAIYLGGEEERELTRIVTSNTDII